MLKKLVEHKNFIKYFNIFLLKSPLFFKLAKFPKANTQFYHKQNNKYCYLVQKNSN